jgi:hypothetical protein
MLPTVADLERAEQYLEPPAYTTDAGVLVVAHQAREPFAAGRAAWIAYKTYTPARQRALVNGPAVLFLPDAHQDGSIYEPACLALAEAGIFAASLSLSGHGNGRWFSLDERPLREMGLAEYLHHVELVTLALPISRRHLVVVGGGILGSVIAQQVARQQQEQDTPLAGLVLLGGCLPSLAASAWEMVAPRRSVHPVWGVLAPDTTQVRAWWFDDETDEETVFAVRLALSAESPLIREDYQALAEHPFLPPALPALVIGGALDRLTRAGVLAATAEAYQVSPKRIAGAPALLARSLQRQALVVHLAEFCRDVVRSHES